MLNKLNTTAGINIFRANRPIYFADNKQGGPVEAANDNIKTPSAAHLTERDRINLGKIVSRAGNKSLDKSFVEAAEKGKLPKHGLAKIIDTVANRGEKRIDDVLDFQKKLINGDFNKNSPLASLVASSLADAPRSSDEYKCAVEISRKDGKITDSADVFYKGILHNYIEKREEKFSADLKNPQDQTHDKAFEAGKTMELPATNKLGRKPFPPESAERLNSFSKTLLTKLNEGADISEISELVQQHDPELQEEAAYLETLKKQIFKINRFAKDLGLNVNEVIKVWMNKGDSKGIIINPHTLKAEQKMGTVVIHNIWMQSAEEDKANYPEDYFKEVGNDNPAGSIMVDYTDEQGVRHVSEPDQNFRTMILALNGHNELDKQEFDGQVAIALGMKDVQKCIDDKDELIYHVPQSQNTKGIVQGPAVKFRIISADDKSITVDRPLVTLRKEVLSNTTPDPLYNDQVKTTFTLGEFAAFAERASVLRVLSDDERSDVYSLVNEKENRKAMAAAGVAANDNDEVMLGLKVINKTPFKPPAIGESRVVHLSNDKGEERVVDLQRHQAEDGSTVYTYFPLTARSDFNLGNIRSLDDARNKMNQARSLGKFKGVPHGVFGEKELMQLSSDGYVRDATGDEASKEKAACTRGRERDKKARAAMIDKSGGRNMASDSDGDGMQIPSEGPPGFRPPSGDDTKVEEGPPVSLDPPKVYEEALGYEDVFKAGGMTKSDRGIISKLWRDTRVLSVGDIWALCKAGYEYYIRRFERKQKGKYSSVAKGVPFFAPEMQRINQAAETEEVNQFKETFDQKGIWEIQETQRNTDNQDELKATFITLAAKGQMRWDDVDLWENINKFVDSDYRIPIPANRDPKTQISATDPRTGFDFLKDAIDSLWGEGGFNDWFASNKSAYQSGAAKYDEEGKKLEGIEGGHGTRLSILLKSHKEGHFVDPHEYEGLILHAIEAGKSSMQEKIYYMVQGVAARNPQGRTILDSDRMAHINSEKLAKFPILEYMCASLPRKDGKGQYRLGTEDYRYWAELFDGGDVENPENNKPTSVVDRFMWKYVIPSDQTQNRINKAIRHGDGLDHDDMFAYLPPTSEQVITDATMGMAGGGKKFFTVEGYANAIPGFSQYMKALADNGNKTKLLEAVRSYVRFESIVMDRWEKGDKAYQRFDDSTLDGATIVSSTPPRTYINQTNAVVKRLIAHYAQYDPKGELARIGQLIYKDVDRPRENQKAQEDVQDALKKFGSAMARAVKASPDKGESMTNIVSSANLIGMEFMSAKERDARKASKAAASPSSAE